MLTPTELADLKAKINGRRIVASVSGGKDSAAMSLYLMELGLEHDRVFMDTGWEHPATYDYLRGPLTAKLGPIVEIVNEKFPGGMEDIVVHKGMFPSRTRRFCTQKLKVEPMQAHIRKLVDAGEDILNAVGIRAAESEARKNMGEWEWSDGFDCEVWRPLIRWSEQDVIDIHHRHGLTPHPFYLTRNAARIGCYPCIFARKGEIRSIADNDPWRIEQLVQLETKVADAAEARWAAKGSSLAEQGFMRPSFFQAMGAMRSKGREGRMVPIQEVIEWSRTKHGGKEFEPFVAGPQDAGCMRWGLCDTNPDDAG